MTRVEKADEIAKRAHADQMRKVGGEPYIAHPRAVADILRGYGFDDTTVAVALVHDVLEDTSFGEAQLRAELGDEVVDAVKILTEDKSLPWEERKRRYIEAVRAASATVKAVSAADKIHNARSLIEAHAKMGSAVWSMFNRPKEQKLWFEESMLKMFQETWQHPLVDEYAVLVEKMKALD